MDPRETCERLREQLVLHHYGDLTETERAELEGHLAGCAACAEAREAVRQDAAALDRLAVPAPGPADWACMESRLEMRVAPLRARRLADRAGRGRFTMLRRAAAVLVIGGLSVAAGTLLYENRALQGRVGALTESMADLHYTLGDIHAASGMYEEAIAVRALREDPARDRRIAFLRGLQGEEDERPLRLWSQARLAVGDEQRERLAEICYRFPGHWLADEAFVALRSRETPRLRPLEIVAERPLGAVRPPLPDEPADAHYAAEVERLRGFAESAPAKVEAYALLRAARVLEEQLEDPDAAIEAYRELKARLDDGEIHAFAAARLEALTAR